MHNEPTARVATGRRSPCPEAASLYHYLPAGEALISWGVYLTGCGRCTIDPQAPYPPVGHPVLYDFNWHDGRILPEFQVLLITQGHGVFESRSVGSRKVAHGDVIFVVPGEWHRYRPDRQTGWTERWVSLNGDLMHRLQDSGTLHANEAVRSTGDTGDLAAAFDTLLQEVESHPSQNSVTLSLQVMGLVAHILRACGDAPVDPAPSTARGILNPLVAGIVDAIWTHSHRQLSVDELVDSLEVSRRTAERRFRATIGHGIQEEIARCRLSRAKRLLVETRLPIKTVTCLAGFSSEERMRVTFQQQEGCAPGAYRAHRRQA